MKKTAAVIILAGLLLALLLPGCSAARSAAAVPTASGTVEEDTKFGAALTDITPEEFADLGFEPGDSCDVAFGSGYSLSDVPVYDGWYVHDSDPVIVSIAGTGTVRITLNNTGIWDAAGLSSGDTVTFTLNEKGKYADIYESLSQETSDDRADYGSDEQYCNFRALSGGSLKSGFLFRGASPVDDSHGRVSCVNALLEANGIRYILDLGDTEEDAVGFMRDEAVSSGYAGALYRSGEMETLGLGVSYRSDDYKRKLAAGLTEMTKHEGPVYINCLIGRDRTGFVCILLEALAGAGYDEMRSDYMLSFTNYNGLSETGTPSKYQAISDLYFDEYMAYLHGSDDPAVLKEADYTADARNYLMSGGMTEAEVEALREFICQ